MRITFKEVGQGDTILIEWVESGEKKIGLIDCNLKGNSINKALEYLKISSYKLIQFILLSHPHFDHFSGMCEVLEYCEKKSIQINLFLHTSFTNLSYLQSAVRGHVAKSLLDKLFITAERLIKKGIIADAFYVTDTSRDYIFNEKWKMKFIAPSAKEFSEYNKSMYRNNFEISQNNSYANLLSTIAVIYSAEDQILLTSDSMNSVFSKIYRSNFKQLKLNLILGQMPHHGASSNFEKNFWKFQKHVNNTPIVISVGENSYGHPSKEVIKATENLNYEVYLTNDLNSRHSTTSTTISSALDSISTLINSNESNSKSENVIFDTDSLVVTTSSS